MSARTTYAQFYGGLPLPWLVQGPIGQLEAQSWPAFLDAIIVLLDAARKVAYPDNTPADALPHLGGDRQLVQGIGESDANFRLRIKTAWGNSPITVHAPGLPAAQTGGPTSGWALAGTPMQLLEELYFGGFNDSGTLAVIVQQNGLADHLSGIPTAGADNSGLIVEVACSQLSVALTSSASPPTTTQAGRSIPAATPWFQFAESASANPQVSDTDYCNRFAIIYPTPPATYPWSAATLATLQTLIKTWRPNSICVGVYVCTAGKFMGWPVQTQATNTMAATTIVRVWGE